MADSSIREQIVDELVADLEAASAGAEFHYTPAQVLRWQTPALEIAEFPNVGVFDLDESVEVKNFALESRTLKVLLRAIGLAHADGSEDGPDVVGRRLLADLNRATVGVDKGSAVYRLERGSRLYVDDPAEPYVVVELDLEILYRTRFGDPSESKA